MVTNRGYGMQAIRGKGCTTHRLSKFIFHGFDIDSKLFVCHHCDNRKCFNPDHLFIGTNRDNMIDMFKKGRGNRSRGEMSPFSKLSNEKVHIIKAMREDGETYTSIALNFGVYPATIRCVCKQETWAHIGEAAQDMTDKIKEKLIDAAARGSSNGNAKLSESDIPAIKKMRKDGETYKEIGQRFGVSRVMVGAICQGKFWKHVS